MKIAADRIDNYTDEGRYKASLDTIRSMDSKRYEDISRIRNDVNKRLHMAAGMLIKDMCDKLGISDPVVGRDKHGKPYIEDHPEVCFNLSHSGEYAVIAYGDRPVGIDIQEKRRVSESFATRILNETEKQLYDLTDADMICRVWTMKEAYSKLIGLGLSYDFRNCVIDREHSRIDDTTGIYISGTYKGYRVDNDTYMTVVYESSDCYAGGGT